MKVEILEVLSYFSKLSYFPSLKFFIIFIILTFLTFLLSLMSHHPPLPLRHPLKSTKWLSEWAALRMLSAPLSEGRAGIRALRSLRLRLRHEAAGGVRKHRLLRAPLPASARSNPAAAARRTRRTLPGHFAGLCGIFLVLRSAGETPPRTQVRGKFSRLQVQQSGSARAFYAREDCCGELWVSGGSCASEDRTEPDRLDPICSHLHPLPHHNVPAQQ